MTILQFRKAIWGLSVATVGAMSLTACLTPSNSKIDYRSSVKASTTSLEVPPGLSDYDKNSRYDLSGVVSARTVAQLQSQTATNPNTIAVLPMVKDMHIERAGETRWLVVDNRTAEQIWPALQSFWQENGFTLKTDQPSIGIIETDWAENRAKLPQTGLRKLLGGVLDGLYDTGYRDMFRTRVEKTAHGLEIYISHRGMEEVYTSADKVSTTWQPRATDPQLEAEMLTRLMTSLGVDKKTAQAAVQNADNTLGSATIQGNSLLVNDTMENTWRRVGQTLDRVGLSVTDRDISRRIYFVTPNPDDRGLFRKDFGKLKETYQVQFSTITDKQIKVSFADKAGQPYNGDGLARILKNLHDNLQ